MAVGIGADYAMYFLFRAREELAQGGDLSAALQRALTTSGKAVLFVSSAIAFGYATLCLSGFAVHVQLGGLVALAMLVSSASALLLLPAIIVLFRPSFLVPRLPRLEGFASARAEGVVARSSGRDAGARLR
jgi:hypothetical protein